MSDINGLINTVIKNNEKDKKYRKITIIYQNTKYTSTEELKQLYKKLDTSNNYYAEYGYDYWNYYIKSITLSQLSTEDEDCIKRIYARTNFRKQLDKLMAFEGYIKGSSVKKLLKVIMENYQELQYYTNIIYEPIEADGTGQTTNINLNENNYEINSEKISDLMNKIKSPKTYRVMFDYTQGDYILREDNKCIIRIGY